VKKTETLRMANEIIYALEKDKAPNVQYQSQELKVILMVGIEAIRFSVLNRVIFKFYNIKDPPGM
jgi:hypothetical protein